MDDVEAVVLVGGKGTRLRPLTLSAPKPMLPTAGVPFLAHLLSRIRAAGVRRVVLGTSYLAETFSEYFGDGSEMGLELEYVVETEPLGTGGGIRNVLKYLTAPDVLVFNGDVLCGTDLNAVVDTHRRTKADATLHLVRVQDPRAFGCVPTDDDGRVTAFLEKTEDPPTDQINAGCYVFRREVIESIPEGRPVSVERETFPGLLEAGARVSGHVDTAYWRDLGTPLDLVHGSADLVRGVAPSAALPGPAGEALLLDGAQVDDTARVFGGTIVGRGVTIGKGARVDASMLFDGAVVEDNARVVNSVVGNGARIEESAALFDAVVGDRAVVGAGCELRFGMRVWPDVTLPPHGLRFSPDV
ncbi:sugar phosphate nucleotidyltransferase [Pseudonocardia sp. MH-G8]|uniref:sugar phosphate nucleotidyltransferase n=1 Tax=Pseudonocardia sp. MH-G8 TaxID=1854588 RepID=UPI000B9FC08F|nr:NDP-sugar synthase [Pseudonocardia sp. MH-G8]OZM77698.1 GDP-mannose pyrophosphorylase [Pseudonocardia sp. MH-G8]